MIPSIDQIDFHLKPINLLVPRLDLNSNLLQHIVMFTLVEIFKMVSFNLNDFLKLTVCVLVFFFFNQKAVRGFVELCGWQDELDELMREYDRNESQKQTESAASTTGEEAQQPTESSAAAADSSSSSSSSNKDKESTSTKQEPNDTRPTETKSD